METISRSNFTGPLTIRILPLLAAGVPGVAGKASKRFAANVGEGAMCSELVKENPGDSNRKPPSYVERMVRGNPGAYAP